MCTNPKKADWTHLKRTNSVIHDFSKSPDPVRPEPKSIEAYVVALTPLPTRSVTTIYQRIAREERKIYKCHCGIHTYNTSGKCFLCQSKI